MPSAYSAPTWQDITDCGAAVEASLARTGILLTMGGEPTFVPLNPEGAEWRTAALGPTKLTYARRFAHALLERSHPGAVILETAGKHYPGEPLPRWALLVQWLADGTPLWRDSTLLLQETPVKSAALGDTKQLGEALAGALGVEPECLRPLAERASPSVTTGTVLPLDHVNGRWISDNWSKTLGEGPIGLLPGESAAGLRLPLGELGGSHLQRALTIEVRHGALTIFVPPLLLPGYVALLAAIESTLVSLKLRDVVLAGYAPPPDPAMPTIGLASDPGVLEINLQPCANWSEYNTQLDEIYSAATHAGLCARKLQLNGRAVGTGGGAHLVFGGPAGLLSPFFAFPALLPSVIRFWQRHPALSYAFTGSYLGPSSQAPRIDESTYEAMYELEIACAGAENLGTPANLALFDLLFRDLLMDRSGNTHRAEISVDKLWNPSAPNGRLGLVEFRAFETHPERAVQSVIGLLVRAVIARLAADPQRSPFIRWAGELHDKFFLPTFVWEDLAAICADLQAHGIPFNVEWLRPAWDFRFPKLGSLEIPIQNPESKIQNPNVLFRQALEAWPLLGESAIPGGVARTVDASLDRIEAFVADPELLESGVLLVNGLPCEFRKVEGLGAACGIRYRAFYLMPGLQPHVPVHAPLLLEWVDRETLTVVAAARWHVWNPRQATYASTPADEAEAGQRQTERWEPWPATVGQPRFIPKIDFPPEGRHTLDLRRYPAQWR
jgi:uncharacterized protein (DUF2126 family)